MKYRQAQGQRTAWGRGQRQASLRGGCVGGKYSPRLVWLAPHSTHVQDRGPHESWSLRNEAISGLGWNRSQEIMPQAVTMGERAMPLASFWVRSRRWWANVWAWEAGDLRSECVRGRAFARRSGYGPRSRETGAQQIQRQRLGGSLALPVRDAAWGHAAYNDRR
jgi:hypothetical protein